MLALFKEKRIANCNLCLVFEGENAVGQGVLREVYSVTVREPLISRYPCLQLCHKMAMLP